MHTMWKGLISFGLVNIPIKMFAATENKDVRFRYIHKECNTPIKYRKTCPTCNKEVGEDEIVRGFEYEPGKFVILKEEDFEAAKAEINGRTIEILDFVDLKEIDPIYFDKSYYLAPQELGASKAYTLLKKAMNDSNKIAIAKITIRNKQSLASLRVFDKVIILETIFYPDEVRAIDLVPGLPQEENVDDKELQIATQLIDNLTAEFKPEKYEDDYREALKDIIYKKIQGQEIEVAPEGKEKSVIDLMEALQASIKETQAKAPSKRKKSTTTKKSSVS